MDDNLNNLVEEFVEQRKALKEMILDLEQVKSKINKLFPESLDKRYINFFEEKMKSLSSLFGTILDVRKEIMKSVKTEFELRKILQEVDEKDTILDDIDMDEIEQTISKLKQTHEKQKKEREHLRHKGESHVKLESIN